MIPEAAIFLEPFRDGLQGLCLEMAGAPLRLPAPRDQAGRLQHFEVFGDCREAHIEGLGQFAHGGVARAQPRKKAPPRRIGEGGKGGAEAVGHLYSIK